MAVPESVRKVERPVNTIVEDSGRDTMYRYAVREIGSSAPECSLAHDQAYSILLDNCSS